MSYVEILPSMLSVKTGNMNGNPAKKSPLPAKDSHYELFHNPDLQNYQARSLNFIFHHNACCLKFLYCNKYVVCDIWTPIFYPHVLFVIYRSFGKNTQ